jgi:hypothetical protein
MAGALFALHPIHTESVDWIAAVTDLEMTFFYLLAFWFFLEAATLGGRRLVRHCTTQRLFVLVLCFHRHSRFVPPILQSVS